MPLVWHFCSKTNSDKLERLHYRALKFVYQDFNSSYELLLSNNRHSTLNLQRLRQLALETFKIVHGKSPGYLQELLQKSDSKYSQRNILPLKVQRTKTVKYGTNSFSALATKTWNKLPNHIKRETSFNVFRSLISQWQGETCKCAACR